MVHRPSNHFSTPITGKARSVLECGGKAAGDDTAFGTELHPGTAVTPSKPANTKANAEEKSGVTAARTPGRFALRWQLNFPLRSPDFAFAWRAGRRSFPYPD
jgi:hypothetical protein